MADTTTDLFMDLYKGRTDAWGSVEGRSNKEPVGREHYQKHLDGKQSLGVYMLQDDSTCWFFALDLDEKNIQIALDIRSAFADLGIPTYCAESKGKGYHVYGYAGPEPFVAEDIRRVCRFVLANLGIATEIFPKQDKLDPLTPLGNYINLPCYGFTRQFFDRNLKTVKLEDALSKIQKIPKSTIDMIVGLIPPPVIPTLVPKKTKGKSKKGQHPPCVETMLQGVDSGARDVAAFALARHHLDMGYIEEEVLGLLQVWDKGNKPPINDLHQLEIKVKSASKGYGFGCSSVMDEPVLQKYCVGKANCVWLVKDTAEKVKRGLIRETSWHESETHLYEQIMRGGKDGPGSFVALEKATGDISYADKLDYPDFAIVPINAREIPEGAVTLPTDVMEYGTTLELVEELGRFIQIYVDLKPTEKEFCVWYVMMSWVYDRLNTISYLRFHGDTGCGKSRCLDIIGRLSYKPLMMAGAVTPAPIYRLIRRWRGTLILEEADFSDSTEKSEVVTILNSGFERNRPVIRCSQDNPDNLEILPCFGPKVFATRFKFSDVALEARCLTFTLEETDREDIPPILGERAYLQAEELRNKLLLWRLRNYTKIDPKSIEDIDLGPLEPRLKQIGLPYAVPFKDYPDVMDKFRKFMHELGIRLIGDRADSTQGRVVHAMLKLAEQEGKDHISSSLITNMLSEEFKMDVKPNTVGKILHSLKITTSSRRIAGTRKRYLEWNQSLMRKLWRRYVSDPEDYEEMFTEIGTDKDRLLQSDLDMEV